MTRLIERLIYLLGFIAGQLEKWQRERREREAQQVRNELEADYRHWYDQHFGGLPDDADDAGEADKTDTKPR